MQQLERAEERLDIEGALNRDFRMLVDGQLVAASDGGTFEARNPATGALLAVVPNASSEDVDRAVASARAASRKWARLNYNQRHAFILELANRLRENGELYSLLDCLDTGNILRAMRNDIGNGAGTMEYYGAIGYEIKGEATQLDDQLHYTRREPFGVVLRLLPFNHPIASAAAALAAPLLAGNCVILKPSPHTTLSTLAFASAAQEVLPPGVLSVITGTNDRASVPLIRHPGVDRIGLTGSSEAGRAVMRYAADRLVPLTLELGGKNPLIVFPDFDPFLAADIAVKGMNFGWQSHSCAATSRVLVHESIRDRFVEALVDRIRKVKVGNPLSPDSDMGAITYRALFDRCVQYISQGQRQGARLLVGGVPARGTDLGSGLYLTPAVFGNVEPDMEIAREEIFGPVISIMTWRDYDSMIEVANSLPYGLTAVVATNELQAAHQAAMDLEVGYVEVNGPISFALGSPYGGLKQSGFGREGSLEELLGYTRTKSVNVRLSGRRSAELA